MENIENIIANECSLDLKSVIVALELFSEGSTVPFIARYRKEKTGGLNEEQLREILEKKEYLDTVVSRKKTVLATLEKLGIEDESLYLAIDKTTSLVELEDLYRPYKPKKMTRAKKAIDAGLQPLADYLLTDETGTIDEEAKKYINEKYPTSESCIQGAMDIIAESLSDAIKVRTFIRNDILKHGIIKTDTTEKDVEKIYDNYKDYQKKLSLLKSYNILAIERGCKEEKLERTLLLNDDLYINFIYRSLKESKVYDDIYFNMAKDAYKRLVLPSLTNEVFSYLFEEASNSSIKEFKITLKEILLTPPLRNKRVLGFDPGFMHGCKIAVVDEKGDVLKVGIINNPFMNENSKRKAKEELLKYIKSEKVDVIAIGNGTASRESEHLIKEMIKEYNLTTKELIVSESGASIYSVTKIAKEEFPEYEPNIRSAISIARRLQDSLAELVKIPPESIGVGQYQHDIDEKKLKNALKDTVVDVVNYVGVNLNSASEALLSYISGINNKVAHSIVEYRKKNGIFHSRDELLNVPYLGEKCFENCAGFLRIPESEELLDNTSLHPENYLIAHKILNKYSLDEKDDLSKLKELSENDKEILSSQLNISLFSLNEIINELIKPTRDPREEMKMMQVSEELNDIKDLKVGSIYEGTIRNITQFGFFVDLGIEINGLVYIKDISSTRVNDPHDYGKIGDIIKVKVISVDLERKRISLSMKGVK